ncbi:hypothetical protein ACWD11_24295 [Streptomyces sp. NPDC002776]
MTRPAPFMTPDPQVVAASRIMDFARSTGQDGTDYAALHRWSVTDLEGFWGAVWEYFDMPGGGHLPRRPSPRSHGVGRGHAGVVLGGADEAARPAVRRVGRVLGLVKVGVCLADEDGEDAS